MESPQGVVKHKRRRRRRHHQQSDEQAFYSPMGSPQAAAHPPPPPPQHKAVRVDLVIVPSPVAKRGQNQRQQPRQASGRAPTASSAAQVVPQPAAAARRDIPVAVAARHAIPAAAGSAPEHSRAQAGPAAAEAPAPAPQQRQRNDKANVKGSSSSKASKKRRAKGAKTLTAKGKRAAVLGVLAATELAKADAAADAAAAAAEAPPSQQQQQQQRQEQQQQVEQREAAPNQAAAPAPAAPAAPAAPPTAVPAADTANLGRGWSKADISTLARLAEDRTFLLQTIPGHPAEGQLDWELISRHFGRYSRGGYAVRHQYGSVVRLVKQARHEGRKGASYVELVSQALAALPSRQGTIFEVQAVLKRDHAACLDKYRVKGILRWKLAVREVLKDQPTLFEQAGKAANGKILWRLREPEADAA